MFRLRIPADVPAICQSAAQHQVAAAVDCHSVAAVAVILVSRYTISDHPALLRFPAPFVLPFHDLGYRS